MLLNPNTSLSPKWTRREFPELIYASSSLAKDASTLHRSYAGSLVVSGEPLVPSEGFGVPRGTMVVVALH